MIIAKPDRRIARRLRLFTNPTCKFDVADPNRKFTHVAIGLAKCNNRSLPESAESLGLQEGEYVDAPVATTHRLTFPAFRRRFVSDLLHQPSIGLDDFCFADLDAFEI